MLICLVLRGTRDFIDRLIRTVQRCIYKTLIKWDSSEDKTTTEYNKEKETFFFTYNLLVKGTQDSKI